MRILLLVGLWDWSARRPQALDAGLSGGVMGRGCQLVAVTMSPLAAVSAATRVIAAVGLARSVPIPAISAPRAKPKSRQKRYTLTTRARSRGWHASETAAISVG